MKLSFSGIQDRAAWEGAGVRLPRFDWQAMCAETEARPVWVHFGAGNIFRGFVAVLQQELLEKGLAKGGIIAADTSSGDLAGLVYRPYDSMTLLVRMMPDGRLEKQVVASVAKALRVKEPADLEGLRAAFRNPSLQMVSYTITEKGYALSDLGGSFLPQVQADLEQGPDNCVHAMGVTAALLFERYKAGKPPIAVVSMDNCSHNGEKLRASVLTVAEEWKKRGFVDGGFVDWISDESKVSFPWSMIDKITPRPAQNVADELKKLGIEGMELISDGRTPQAAFVNAEAPQYLVVEDRFPNGRPPLEKAGVYMTDRDTVNLTERMKVTTCLNPLHTALAIYGCLLGFQTIASEMTEPLLKGLVSRLSRDEGMRVVEDPGILSPSDFLTEVLERRFPNPFLPDTPQRIATDTSQKLPVRFGETIKAYVKNDGLDVKSLTCIPLVIAGWIRYLIGVDDEGKPMTCSPDPMLEALQKQLAGVELGRPETLAGKLAPILSNDVLFGSDLLALGLGEKIEGMAKELLAGPGAVRATLAKYLA